MVRFASSAPAPSGLNASRQEVWKEHHLLHHISYLIVLSGWNRLCFTNAPTAQSTRKLIPDRLAVTSPSAQVLLSCLPLRECSASGRSSATRPAVTSPRQASVSPDSMR